MLFETSYSHELNLAKSTVAGTLSLSILPILLAIFLPFIYVLSDTVFIEKIRPELFDEFLAISPFALIPSILLLLFATGTSGLITKYIAQDDYDTAESIAGSGVIWSILIGLSITGLGFYFLNSTNFENYNISTELTTYLLPILIAVPFLFLTLIYLELLRAQGKTMIMSLIIVFSLFLNIALNYIANEFSGFQIMGVSGASTASLIITSLILMAILSSGRTVIKVKAEHCIPSPSDLISIIANSSPFFSLVASMGITITGLFMWINQYLPSGLGNDIFQQSFLISSALCFILFSPCFALLLAYQTLSIFNLSTFMYQRVKQAHKFTIRVISIYGVLLSAAILMYPLQILNFLAIDAQLHEQIISLSLILTIGSTLFFINAAWSTFLQTQNSLIGANLIAWMPTALLTAVYFSTDILKPYVDFSQNIEFIWYIFIVAQLLTSVFAWIRFTVAFHEINKVKIEKPEKVTKLKVKTSHPSQAVIEKVVVHKSKNKQGVADDFDDDFISSFSHNDDEQLEDIDDIDEFEKAMQSYNQKMETGNPVAKNQLINEKPVAEPEQKPAKATNQYASNFDDELNITTTTKTEVEDTFQSASEINAEEVLNEIPESDNDFGMDIFSNDKPKKPALDDTNKTTADQNESAYSSELELSDEFSDFENELSESLENSTKDLEFEFPTKDGQHEEEELILVSDFDVTTKSDIELISEDTNSATIESKAELPAKDKNANLNSPSKIKTNDFKKPVIQKDTQNKTKSPIETPLSNNKPKTAPLPSNIKSKKTKTAPDNTDELSTDLEKINSEFDELFNTHSQSDLTNLDELISQVDVNNSTPINRTIKNNTIESQPTDNKLLFVSQGDEEILEIFIEEAQEILEVLPMTIQALKKNRIDKKLAKEIQRDFHTLKGGSRMASIEPMGDICHQYEMLFESICNGRKKVDGQVLKVIESGFNEIQLAIKNIQTENQHHFDMSLIEKVKAI